MITTQEGLKDLVLWMRNEKVSSFTVNGISITFAPRALLTPSKPDPSKTPEQIQIERNKLEEEILFYSAG